MIWRQTSVSNLGGDLKEKVVLDVANWLAVRSHRSLVAWLAGWLADCLSCLAEGAWADLGLTEQSRMLQNGPQLHARKEKAT
jgi:hypothetical protein